MNREYPFIALCSSVMNTKAARKKFSGSRQAELLREYNLTRNQIKILRTLDLDGMVTEIRKEIVKASRSGSDAQKAMFAW
jgi:hypothetical protein